MNIQVMSDITPTDRSAVRGFMEQAYGGAFHPIQTEIIVANADKFIVGRHIGGLAAAAALAEHRVTTLVAVKGETPRDTRRARGLEIAEVCHDDRQGVWVSVGESYPRVADFFRVAGMTNVRDLDLALAMLQPINPNGPPCLERTDAGDLVAVSTQHALRPGYRQHLLHWADRVELLEK